MSASWFSLGAWEGVLVLGLVEQEESRNGCLFIAARLADTNESLSDALAAASKCLRFTGRSGTGKLWLFAPFSGLVRSRLGQHVDDF